jgi:MFS family permease
MTSLSQTIKTNMVGTLSKLLYSTQDEPDRDRSSSSPSGSDNEGHVSLLEEYRTQHQHHHAILSTGDHPSSSLETNLANFVADSGGTRSMDDYFTEAYHHACTNNEEESHEHRQQHKQDRWSSLIKHWRYYLIFLNLGIANVSDTTETVCIGYVLSNPEFQTTILHHDLGVRGAMVASAVIAGMISGGLLAGAFEDSLGRKQTLMLGLGSNTVTGLVSALSPNVACLIVARFLCGMGIGAITSVLSALASELSPPKERGCFVSITTGIGVMGSIYSAFVGYLCFGLWGWSWRVFLTLATVPNIVGLIAIGFGVPDSPRSLALHGDYKAAASCANRTVVAMGYKGSLITASEIEAHMIHESEKHRGSTSTKGKVKPPNIRASVVEAWRNIRVLYTHDATTRRTTLTLQVLFAAIGSGSGVGLWINTILKEIHVTGVYLTTFLMAIGSVPGIVVSAILIDKVGRKPLFSAFVGATSIFLACLALVVMHIHGAPPASPVVLVFASLYNACFSASWNVVFVMVAEAFPTEVRGTGIGVCAATGRIAIVAAQFVYGALVDKPAALLGTGSVVLLLGSMISCCVPLPDMANKPLSDSVADNNNALTQHDEAGKASPSPPNKTEGITSISVDRNNDSSLLPEVV